MLKKISKGGPARQARRLDRKNMLQHSQGSGERRPVDQRGCRRQPESGVSRRAAGIKIKLTIFDPAAGQVDFSRKRLRGCCSIISTAHAAMKRKAR
jgi:hypothetical protein